MRVPTPNVSLIELLFVQKDLTIEKINSHFKILVKIKISNYQRRVGINRF